MQSIQSLSQELNNPSFATQLRQFLYDQIYDDSMISSADIPLDLCPHIQGNLSVYNLASSTFYAPSERASTSGLHRKVIRSAPSWYNKYERRDTVLVQVGDEDDIMAGMQVAWVMRFLSVTHDGERIPFAYVEWFKHANRHCDLATGLWVVEPEKRRGQRAVGLVHMDTIVRGCHLIPVYGASRLPSQHHFADSLDAFTQFYVNRYADYHSHEYIL